LRHRQHVKHGNDEEQGQQPPEEKGGKGHDSCESGGATGNRSPPYHTRTRGGVQLGRTVSQLAQNSTQ
jgi:hypothetical protein